MLSIKKIYQLNYIFNLIFKEYFKKKLKFDWSTKPKRFDIINKIIDKNNYQSYLEIGCFDDETFSKVAGVNKVGVDPVSGGTIRETSDIFFQKNQEKFDLIFIDGLHEYEQVKKDIENSLKFINDNGVILLHDCLPVKIREQMMPRSHEQWTGDVWKAIVESRTLQNRDTYTCIADQGIGIIFKRNNRNILKIDTNNFKRLRFKDYYFHNKEYMNLVEVEKVYDLFK